MPIVIPTRLHGILNSAIVEGRAAPAIGEIDLHGTNRERTADRHEGEVAAEPHVVVERAHNEEQFRWEGRNLEHCAVGELGPLQFPNELCSRSEHAVGVLFVAPAADIDLTRECLIVNHLQKTVSCTVIAAGWT